MTALKTRLLEMIEQDGPLTIAQYMSLCLHDPAAGYYATRPGLGAGGDFITAPETSQMFGEMIGLWCALTWLEMGAPAVCNLIEAGPGSGVLMADIWRASKADSRFRDALRIYMIEPSKLLREAQRETLAKVGAKATWIDDFDAVPDGPAIVIGNEVLDCLPIRQFVRTESGWLERVVGRANDDLAFGLVPAPPMSALLEENPVGSIVEMRVGLPAFIDKIAGRIRGNGRALLIDYGAEHVRGDTFQAVRAHASANPLDDPGAADLTAHVDFAAVAALARNVGLSVSKTISQRDFLRALGVETRAQALQKARPEKAPVIERQLQRLIGEDQMGALFKAICLSSPHLPTPAGFV